MSRDHLDRRHNDLRIDALQQDMTLLHASVSEMKETVKEMHDILASFRVLAAVAKWITAIAGAVAAVYAGYHSIRH